MTTALAHSHSLGLRMRPDLVVRRQHSATNPAWIVKDPISLRYFTFSAQEMAILQWLDGSKTLDEIRHEFQRSFPPHEITPLQLQCFLANLHENGLLVVDGIDQGQLLMASAARQRRRERWQTWTNWLSIRFPGIDPDRFLSWLYPKFRWCFSGWVLAMCGVSVVVALLFMAAHAAEFRRQLPSLAEMIHPSNMLWVLVAFITVKVLHELAHALVCKHYGGECHEMGVMLLVFAPCLYCNVTDSWMLQSRWQRIVVSLAGIFVEIQLAALAVFLWWYTQDGLLHTMALNTIVVCTVGTLLFNGNPLLKYDGYFVLADLLEVPNLWQESRAAVKRLLAKWFLTEDSVPPRLPGDRLALTTSYGIASLAYRAFLLVAIFLFLHRALVPHGLGILIPILAICLLLGVTMTCGNWLRQLWNHPTAWQRFRRLRLLLTAAAVGSLLWIFFMVPLPCQVRAPALLQPLAAHRVYVSTPGTLERCVPAGKHVAAQEVLAQLSDAELHREVLRLAGQQQLAQTRVANLRARLADEPALAAQLQVAEEMLADVEQQLAQRRREEQALLLRAPAAGLVMEPPAVPNHPATKQALTAWSGTPLDAKNLHCFLERGTLLCLIGDPSQQEAVLFVDETDVQLVRMGQRVRLQFSILPNTILAGEVQEIAQRNLVSVPRELAADQLLENRPDDEVSRRPVRTTYSVRVTLDEHDGHLLAGARGWAKISVDDQPLAMRALRALRRTLTVDL